MQIKLFLLSHTVWLPAPRTLPKAREELLQNNLTPTLPQQQSGERLEPPSRRCHIRIIPAELQMKAGIPAKPRRGITQPNIPSILCILQAMNKILCIVASVPRISWYTFCLSILLVFRKLFGDCYIKPFGCFIAVTNTWQFWRYSIKI